MNRRKPPLTALQKRYSQAGATPLPNSDSPSGQCHCGGRFIDTPEGHDAHEIVFGHQPIVLTDKGDR